MTPPPQAPLMVDAKAAAALCGVSPATWHRMLAAGKTPAPVRLSGGCVRYRTADLADWIARGCPCRAEWLALRNEIGGPAR